MERLGVSYFPLYPIQMILHLFKTKLRIREGQKLHITLAMLIFFFLKLKTCSVCQVMLAQSKKAYSGSVNIGEFSPRPRLGEYSPMPQAQ